jgi:hypothetical protein
MHLPKKGLLLHYARVYIAFTLTHAPCPWIISVPFYTTTTSYFYIFFYLSTRLYFFKAMAVLGHRC